jgi:hypothetical protein
MHPHRHAYFVADGIKMHTHLCMKISKHYFPIIHMKTFYTNNHITRVWNDEKKCSFIMRAAYFSSVYDVMTGVKNFAQHYL